MKRSNNQEYHLDEMDKKIVYLLMDNAKTSLAHISDRIGISTTAVHQRIKKLENAGVIENSISFLNPKRIGYKVLAFIGIFLEKPQYYEKVVKKLDGINEVVEAHYTTGSYSILLKVLTKDNDHLMEVLNAVQGLDGVLKTETFISLEQSIARQLKV